MRSESGSAMKRDDEWDLESLAELWRQDDGPSLADIRADIRAALARSRLILAVETAVAAGGIAAGAFLMSTGETATGGATVVFSLFAGAAAFFARFRSWRIDGDALAVDQAALEREARFLRRIGRAGYAVAGAAVLFLIGVTTTRADAFASTRSRAVLMVALIFIVGNAIWSARAAAAARARCERLRGARQALEYDEED